MLQVIYSTNHKRELVWNDEQYMIVICCTGYVTWHDPVELVKL